MKCLNINLDIIYGLFITIAFLIVAILSIRGISSLVYYAIKRKRLNAKKSEVFELLLKEYKKDTLNKKSVRSIYRQIIEKEFDYPLEDCLNSFMLYVRKNDSDGKQTKDIEPLIDSIIEEESEREPFSKLDESERHLLSSIKLSVKNKLGEDCDSINNDLKDLAGVIEKKQRVINEAQITKKRSTFFTILSLVLTALNIVVVFVYRPSLSEKSINTLSVEISRQMDSIMNKNLSADTIHNWIDVEDSY